MHVTPCDLSMYTSITALQQLTHIHHIFYNIQISQWECALFLLRVYL